MHLRCKPRIGWSSPTLLAGLYLAVGLTAERPARADDGKPILLAQAHKKKEKKEEEAKPADGKPSMNVLTLACTTNDADVFVDGDKVGLAPIEMPVPVTNGSHTIKVTKLGFAPYVDVFTAKKGVPVKLEVELNPVSGVVHIKSKVAGARVLIDGKYVGDAPTDVEVDVGPRAIQVSKGGYKDFFKDVMAKAGVENEVQADLEELPPELNPYIVKPPPPLKWYQKKWIWAVAGGVAAAAAVGVTVGVVVGNKAHDPADFAFNVSGALRSESF